MKQPKILLFGYGLIGKKINEKLTNNKSNLIILTRLKEKNYNNIYNINFEKEKEWEKYIENDIIIIFTLSFFKNNKSEKNNIKEKNNFYKSFEKLLYLSRIKKVKRFIYLSSASVYGLSYKEKISEKVITKPLSDYGKEKKYLENKLNEYSEFMEILILRISNIFINENILISDNLIDKIIFRKINNKILNFHGSKNDIRDFINLDLVVEIICKFTKKNLRKKLNIYNLSSGFGISFAQIFKIIGIKNIKYKKKIKESTVILSNSKIKKIYKSNFSNNEAEFEKNLQKKLKNLGLNND